MQMMAKELRDKPPFYKQLLDNLISRLYLEVLRTHPAQEPDSRHDIIRFAQAFIDEYYTQKIDFKLLPTNLVIAMIGFVIYSKEKIKLSPSQYILQRRIEHAKTMLRHTPLQISVIAMECGFSTDAQFCSLFKRETEITPTI